jgi:sugar lactone lactonase YvrE
MRTNTLIQLFSITAITTGLVACGDDTETSSTSSTSTTATTGTTGTATSTATSTTGAGGNGGSGGGGGSGGAGGAAPGLSFIAEFDPAMGELPEGLAVVGTDAYVGFAGLGSIVKVDLTNGTVASFATVPPIPMNEGFMLGIATAANGDVFVGLASFSPNVVAGIYKVTSAGGAATLFASDPGMTFPNGLAFDGAGDLFVTDSASGTIFKVDGGNGNVSTWLAADPLLVGAKDNCPMAATPFDIGANGIVVTGTDVYVANTNLASVVKVPVAGGGMAGAAALFAGPDCATLGGADGLALDGDGTLLIALNSLNTISRIATDGTVSSIASGAPLNSPASLAIATVGGQKAAYITNFALFTMTNPGLLELPLP